VDVTVYSELGSEVRREGGLVAWRMSPDIAQLLANVLDDQPEPDHDLATTPRGDRRWWVEEMDALRRAARLTTREPADG
jgi:hypothetical protein